LNSTEAEGRVKLTELALKCGFTSARLFDPLKIKVYSEVRDACVEDKCGSYGKNWACPPACGTLEDCEDRIRGCKSGLIMQTTGVLTDEFDWDGMLRIGEEHTEHIAAFSGEALAEYPYSLVLGAGPCRVCPSCAYPYAPCRFPKQMTCSMEAYGMLVSEVCAGGGLPYFYGRGTLTYVACFLYPQVNTASME
jgi:predicted metal-binding protein